MAIVAQIAVESRRYSGWTDPRYPIGYWQAALELTGNASGGILGIDLLFQQANGGAFLNTQMYSVERIGITSEESINRFVRVSASNMGGPANTAFAHQYAVALSTFPGIGESALAADFLTILPWFLGSQRLPGITAAITLLTANIDGVAVKFEAEGYRWSPRSVLVDGGPQRPPTGPYGR